MVGRSAQVGHSGLPQERERRLDEPDRRRDEPAVGVPLLRPPEVRAEELPGRVEEVDLHGRPMLAHPAALRLRE